MTTAMIKDGKGTHYGYSMVAKSEWDTLNMLATNLHIDNLFSHFWRHLKQIYEVNHLSATENSLIWCNSGAINCSKNN